MSALFVASCTSHDDVVVLRSDHIAADATSTTSVPTTTPHDGPGSSGGATDTDEVLAELTEAGFCDPDVVGGDGFATAMHFVVDGELQPPCYVDQVGGADVDEVVVDDDPRLITAWDSLVATTPHELLSDISLFVGFEPCTSCDTLAFVATLDEDATFFAMAVDVVSGESDPDELRLTLMHELSHVFGQKPGEQLDIDVVDASQCDTFFNGAGCFTTDSYMWNWVQSFWPPELLDTLDVESSDASGVDDALDERCRTDAAYTGLYAATSPEEDFAETFSAYVYDVEVDDALDDKLAFFDDYPEFVALRDNARGLGLDGTEGDFTGCG